MNEKRNVEIDEFLSISKEILAFCKEFLQSSEKKKITDLQFEDLKEKMKKFNRLVSIERRKSKKSKIEVEKGFLALVDMDEGREKEKLSELWNQRKVQNNEWDIISDRLGNIVYFHIGRVLFFKDKVLSNKIFNKIKDGYQEAYSVELIRILANKETIEYCEEIGFGKALLKILANAIGNSSGSFQDFSLLNDLKRIRSKKNKTIIYLINFYVLKILDELIVRFDESERKVAHYTSLFGFDKLVSKSLPLRLNSADLMNDPSEGNLLLPYLGLSNETEDNTFLSCFTFNHNSLNQFRLYGRTDNKEGTGISLVLNKKYFSNKVNGFIFENLIGLDKSTLFKRLDEISTEMLPLFRCAYIDVKTGYVEVARRNKSSFYQEYAEEFKKDEIHVKWMAYLNLIESINLKVSEDLEMLKKLIKILKINNIDNSLDIFVQRSLRPLRFIFKHIAFQEEQECRIFYITNLKDDKVKIPDNEQRVIFEYKQNLRENLENIYIGPALANKYTFVKKVLIDFDVKIKVCDSPFFNQ